MEVQYQLVLILLQKFKEQEISTQTHAGNSHTSYPFGTTLSVTPSASTDLFEIKINTAVEGQQDGYYAMAMGVHTSDSWGSNTGDSRLRLNEGEHTRGMGSGSDTERYQHWFFGWNLYYVRIKYDSEGTQYYFKPHVHTHSPARSN